MRDAEDEILLRPATAQDAETLCVLWLDLMHEHEALDERFALADDAAIRWKNDFPLWLEDRTQRFFVTEHAGDIIGFIRAHRWVGQPVFKMVPEVYINEIYIAPGFRQHGAGRKLLHAVRLWAEEVGAERIRLGVLSANETGIAFWEREGASKLSLTYTLELDPKTESERQERRGKLGF